MAKGGIIYGLQLEPDSWRGQPVIGIQSRPETWAYFESREPYQVEQVTRLAEQELETLIDHENPTQIEPEADSLAYRDLPILFGRPEISVHRQGVIIFADIVASAFFWLSDWQQCYITDRDEHGRVPFKHSLQHALGVGQRPLVNEYAWLLEKAAQSTGQPLVKRQWPNSNFALAITFDIDSMRKKRVQSVWEKTKSLTGNDRQGSSVTQNWKTWGRAVGQSLRPSDPTRSSLTQILDQLEQQGLNGTFFLKSIIDRHSLDERDYLDTAFFRRFLDRLKNHGHEIAFHSSYEAGVNPHLLESELEQLRTYTDVDDIVTHRAHYLRYDPVTLIDELCHSDLRIDSSIGWADQIGFRTGSCWPHRWFNIAENKVSEIWEMPMMAMDLQLTKYMRLNAEQARERMRKQIDVVSRWNGILVWNLHEDLYDSVSAPGWSSVFEDVLQYAMSKQPTVTPMHELRELWIQNV
jgi:hypothetical protein